MKKFGSSTNTQGSSCQLLIATIFSPLFLAFFLALAILLLPLASAMAHGDQAHESTSQTQAASETSDPAHTTSESSHEEASPHLHSEENHAQHAHDEADATNEKAHDHSAHGPNEALLKTGYGRFLVWLGKFHPAAVHFPIALLLGAALAELLSLKSKSRFFSDAARYSLWLGTMGAIGAATLGWFYGGFRLVDEEAILTFHRWNGTGLAILALVTLWLNERRMRQYPSRNSLYRTALLVTALLVGINGYLGGVMVYGKEQHQWPAIPSESAH